MAIKAKDKKSILTAVDEITYDPTTPEREVKAAFWASFGDTPINGELTLAVALQQTQDNRLNRWWSKPGFKAWFCNKDEFRQRVEYLANIALDTIQDILTNPDANPNARQNAAKLMIEVANKMPSRNAKERFIDGAIQEMGKKELDAYIARHQPKLVNPQPPESTSDDDSST